MKIAFFLLDSSYIRTFLKKRLSVCVLVFFAFDTALLAVFKKISEVLKILNRKLDETSSQSAAIYVVEGNMGSSPLYSEVLKFLVL